jgi:hypothetical protein
LNGVFFAVSSWSGMLTIIPKQRRKNLNTSITVEDYATRSVRRASGLVLVGNPEIDPLITGH